MRILIVEDEPNLGRQLRSTLEGAGYAVDLATDGEDGHYLGSTESYDAVILDLGWPDRARPLAQGRPQDACPGADCT
jgi:two-component system OmpR family response regulator